MANLKEEVNWEPGIYQLETTDPVIGGPDGIDNKQASQLANRTQYLKNEVNAIKEKTELATDEKPGIVQLSNDIDSDSEETAATSKALKDAIDSMQTDCLASTIGYEFSSNGILTQWGTVNTAATGENVTTFPIAFPEACFSLVAVAATTSGSVQKLSCSVLNGTTTLTHFSTRIWDIGTAGAVAGLVRWYAVGK